jgi:hypothetical protein
VIGRGAVGDVYRARLWGTDVAVKAIEIIVDSDSSGNDR